MSLLDFMQDAEVLVETYSHELIKRLLKYQNLKNQVTIEGRYMRKSILFEYKLKRHQNKIYFEKRSEYSTIYGRQQKL